MGNQTTFGGEDVPRNELGLMKMGSTSSHFGDPGKKGIPRKETKSGMAFLVIPILIPCLSNESQDMAMGQTPVPPVNIPIPTKID